MQYVSEARCQSICVDQAGPRQDRSAHTVTADTACAAVVGASLTPRVRCPLQFLTELMQSSEAPLATKFTFTACGVLLGGFVVGKNGAVC
jgi:hypothetical protein